MLEPSPRHKRINLTKVHIYRRQIPTSSYRLGHRTNCSVKPDEIDETDGDKNTTWKTKLG